MRSQEQCKRTLALNAIGEGSACSKDSWILNYDSGLKGEGGIQMKAPLFRDPIYDGAADPVLIWNREAQEWWMIYTNRRATQEGPKFGWVHGTDLGVASSSDGGSTWLYRGTLEGLETGWGRNTFWAPEIIWHDGL
jgi:hypothetical protein